MFYATLLGSMLFASAAIASFKNGNELISFPLEGTATVRCDGFNGRQTATYNCRDVVLDPGAYDYFVGPTLNTAYKVVLRALHQDGSSRIKDGRYNGKTGQSDEAFNLWVSTIFQRPLLEFGKNQIAWEVLDEDDKVLDNGSFQANVSRGTARKCQPAFYNSTDANDCNSQFTVCQRYFEQNNFCRE